MNATIAFAAGAGAFVISYTVIVPLKRWALRWGLTDRPSAKKAHARPTPYLGGIAIKLGMLVPAVAVLGFADQRITAILLAAMAIGLVGLIDDVRPLQPFTKLTVETVAASGVVSSGVQITLIGGWLDGSLTMLWIVVMANSFNLLDNMDGALGAVAMVTAAFLAGTAFVSGEPSLGLILIVLACTSLGFLPHNWAPAKIFMGDSGSLFIGFVLACSAVLLVSGQSPEATIVGLLLPTFVATVDTGVVFLSRVRAGRSPLVGGTDHVSHRLRGMGLRTRAVAVVLGLTAAATGGCYLAMALQWISPLATAVVGSGAALLFISLLQGCGRLRADRTPKLPETRERRP
ncbi:MraY family glycosyltransferase [Nonomuraea basaltis]|uniref:MraY family glycosyltransferase n=1 Tax=Nonomuraea basaltis TaxID=2495887 RepID=UPI00110C6A22|nr:MraY family glycosyltransferase [Nonomuraea basaltis]TMR97250.1 undecaprenyl/decaprenyl-phosphate alpha-N-acetylglucosaminyl 1-phosphate transferase [Nonomuraea basaltis]